MRSKATPPLQALSPKLVPTLLAVLLTFGLATSCGGDAESSTDEAAGDVATGVTLELDLGESNAMASCLPVDAATLSQMAPAFQGTVTAVEGETITLDVDTWYAGVEEADTVQLHAEQGLEALIGGIDFQVGEAVSHHRCQQHHQLLRLQRSGRSRRSRRCSMRPSQADLRRYTSSLIALVAAWRAAPPSTANVWPVT